MDIHPHITRHWLIVGTIALSSLCLGALAAMALIVSPQPSTEQLEERRRQRLASSGRIVDGSIVNAEPVDSTPQIIIYSYRIAGVAYECAQDVSTLGPLVANLRLDYPVQVRYSRDNPADSIIVAETWNGLRNSAGHLKTVEYKSRQLGPVSPKLS